MANREDEVHMIVVMFEYSCVRAIIANHLKSACVSTVCGPVAREGLCTGMVGVGGAFSFSANHCQCN